ncbi:MAG TPA: serine/threonine protein kinase, partial [Phycisphaerales bacterium]|nr:serine/threonine protein kinase [Phycisphaerales bacterium]
VHEWLATASTVSFEELDNLVTQLLDGLEVAHNQGVYHRDLKPENLFLCRDGGKQILKIMDFGLAASVNAARLTRTGQAMGTPIYASPEQLQGDPVDCTTDLYSVGVFIFELATGKLPWKKTDPVALTLQKFKPLPDEPVVFRPDLPMEWNRLVVDLLQGDSSKRPQSVAEVRARWQSGRQGV